MEPILLGNGTAGFGDGTAGFGDGTACLVKKTIYSCLQKNTSLINETNAPGCRIHWFCLMEPLVCSKDSVEWFLPVAGILLL